MSENTLNIIGLEKDIEDPGSGAITRFHVLRAYSVMMIGEGSCSATFASFVSRAAFEAGKVQLAHVTVPLQGLPTGDIARVPHWLAERVLAEPVENALSGATAVYDALPAEPVDEEAAA